MYYRPSWKRSLALQINAGLPFLYQLQHIFKHFNYFKGIFLYLKDLVNYTKLYSHAGFFSFKLKNIYPILFDRFEEAGDVPLHYFHLDIWAAKKVFNSKVRRHFDIGGRLDGFIAHCLVFTQVQMLDIRTLDHKIENLSFTTTNATDMKEISTGAINSLSCLHTVEHFGLGRYGDPIDPYAYAKAIGEMQRVVVSGGDIYFATPVGRQRLEFNAHRVFDPHLIIKLFKGCKLKEFSYVDEHNRLVLNAQPQDVQEHFYACGMYHFKRK